MFRILLTITLLFLAKSNLEIKTDLPSQNKHIEPNETQNVNLFPHEPFVYKSLSLNQLKLDTPEALKQCSIVPASLEVDSIFELNDNFQSASRNEFLFSKKYNKVYAINQRKIVLYRYISQKKHIERSSEWQFEKQCAKSGAMDISQEYLYVFSCEGIVMIPIKTGLAEISFVAKFEQLFYGNKVTALEDVFIWSSMYEGFKVYGKTLDHKLTLKQQVTTFRDNRIYISDITYNPLTGLLYVLNIKEAIYLFERTFNGTFLEYDLISYTGGLGNFILKVHGHNIYIASNYDYESSIVQLQYYRKEVDLVRYFKGYDFIMDMDIIDGKLMVVGQSKLDLYPINVDPRQISLVMNGVTNDHFQDLLGFKRLSGNDYIAVTFDKIRIVRLAIHNPQLHCRYEKEGSYQIVVQIPCEEALTRKELYYDSCQKQRILAVTVAKSGSSYSTISLVFLSLILFAAVIFGLMFWRKGKMRVIDGLVNEIRKLKLKHQQRVEFVEDSQPVARFHEWNNFNNFADQQVLEVRNLEDKSREKESQFYNEKSIKNTQQVRNAQGQEELQND